MSASTVPPQVEVPFGVVGEPRLLAGSNGARVPYAQHRRIHAEPARMRQGELEQLCASVDLRGRGGAGFPVADKLRSLRAGRRIVVVNASESEPASHTDQLLVTTFPHLILDGALIVAAAIRATEIRIVVHTDRAAVTLEQALRERPDGAAIRVDEMPGGFVAGEARAIVRWLSGGPALPPGRRVPPTQHGVYGHPTFLSNAETYAQIAVLAAAGPARYATSGTAHEPGTILLTIRGAVARPGVFEVPIGIELHAALAAAAARPATAVIVGGYHGSWLSPTHDYSLSRAGLAPYAATLGAGVVLVLDDTTCAAGELARIASWLAGESARQCGPCRFGLPALANDLAAIVAGHHQAESVLRRHIGVVAGRGACAHPDGAVRFIRSGMALLRPEIERHLSYRGCGRPIVGQLPIGRTTAR
jgi:NADH:ubiquinone oxidoreductase subunit F (NADH-binding)